MRKDTEMIRERTQSIDDKDIPGYENDFPPLSHQQNCDQMRRPPSQYTLLSPHPDGQIKPVCQQTVILFTKGFVTR